MISMDKKYTTRDGRPVRLLCVDGPADERPVVAILGDMPMCWRIDGRYGWTNDNGRDLIEVKTKRSGWINIYKAAICSDFSVITNGVAYKTKEAALAQQSLNIANNGYITTIQIEWEE